MFDVRNARRTYAYLAVALFVGVLIGYGVSKIFSNHYPEGTSITREGGYEFVNPLLSCDISEDAQYPGFAMLKEKLQTVLRSLISDEKVSRASVYFRDLNRGLWTGINPDDDYIPASLMKVPLMIAYLHDSQTNPGLLSTSIFVPDGTDKNKVESIKPTEPVAVGNGYSVEKLIEAMIEQSDNNAADVLNEKVATTSINNVYEQFGIPRPDENDETMDPKSYMRLYRILYNASYLWRAKSQTALKLLSTTAFKDGIVAGVPVGTPVAHKFGERTVFALNMSPPRIVHLQLHDCGIVYYPRSPYGLCIMTEGKDFTDLKTVIATISKTVYAEVQTGLLSSGQ